RAHRVTEHDGGGRAEVVEQGADALGEVRHAQLLPRERLAAPEAGQVGVDHPQPQAARETGGLPPVDAAAGEETVEVDGPGGRVEVVGHRVAPVATVDRHLAVDHAHAPVLPLACTHDSHVSCQI